MSIETLCEEIKSLQKSVALLQSYVANIISFLESEAAQAQEEKRKRKQYIEVGYRG